MSLFNLNQPRRFDFQPRNSRAGEEKRIRLRRITHYDPHANSRFPLRLLIIIIVIGLLFLMIGGTRPHLKTPAINPEDAVNQPIEATQK